MLMQSRAHQQSVSLKSSSQSCGVCTESRPEGFGEPLLQCIVLKDAAAETHFMFFFLINAVHMTLQTLQRTSFHFLPF